MRTKNLPFLQLPLPLSRLHLKRQPSNPRLSETTGTGATSLTITTVTGIAGTSTRTITGPDGTILVPPPIPAHPGCELSPQMAKAMEDYAIKHCCDYMKAKNLLRDKIVAKVLENTQAKLMELL
ncbi:hypothetical protein SMAC4_13747 [Sordaria macrospora]|uniref:uncharacterized protein n=1 Tax=Sordaria macrospora TaxID=5147 RepID=UPI002B29E31B|nr:hypothetical protein SMAC4_13747 [Sordaria macrospora]